MQNNNNNKNTHKHTHIHIGLGYIQALQEYSEYTVTLLLKEFMAGSQTQKYALQYVVYLIYTNEINGAVAYYLLVVCEVLC